MSKTADELVIMVVEDHEFQRKTLMHQIRALGYQQLLEAADGIEAQVFLGQNDGTLMSVEYAQRYPILTIACGPTNSSTCG